MSSGWPLHNSNFLIISLVIKTSVPVPKAFPQICQPSCPPALLPSQGQALSEDRHSEVLGEGSCRIVPTKFPKQTTKISQVSLHGPIGVQLSQHLTDGQHQPTVRHLPGQTAFKLGVTISSGPEAPSQPTTWCCVLESKPTSIGPGMGGAKMDNELMGVSSQWA